MSCFIQFANFQGQYYPGNNVVGKAICFFNQSETIREIQLKLSGKEHTRWTVTESYYDDVKRERRNRTIEYYGNHEVLAIERSLRGSGTIGFGRFEYSFNFDLPKDIPGSFNGKYGWIKYFITVTVVRQFKTDYEGMKEFVVVAPIDFNEIRDQITLNPVAYSDDKAICCCCCASDPITMNVHLDKEAYVQGETAKVKVEMTNMSNTNVERVEVKLGMFIKSTATYPNNQSKSDYELLATDNETGVGAHSRRTYAFRLQIPQSTIVPNFNQCRLFKQWVTLEVRAVLPSFHKDMVMSTKIIMGHIPIGEQQQFQNVSQQQSNFYPPQQNNQFFPGTEVPYLPCDSYEPPYPYGHNGAQLPFVHQTMHCPIGQLFPPSS